jgi:hypothetical protein
MRFRMVAQWHPFNVQGLNGDFLLHSGISISARVGGLVVLRNRWAAIGRVYR